MRARLALLIGVILTASAGVYGWGPGGARTSHAAALEPFASCEEFLSYVKRHGLEHVTAWGLPGQPGVVPVGGLAEDAVAVRAAVPAAALVPGVDYSTTNVQVAGVDEPDIVKTDGRRLLALAQGRLFLVDVSGSAPELRGSLTLDDVWVRDLVLLGNRALLLGQTGGPAILGPGVARAVPEVSAAPVTALLEVDLSDPTRMAVTRRLLVDGSYVSARRTGSVARVVVSSYPTGLPFVTPKGPGLRAEREALRRNREVIRGSTIDNWVPYFVLEDGGGTTLAEGSLLDCASAHHPREFSGFGMLTVLTVDLSRGLGEAVRERAVGVLAAGETVYASAGSLYVATQRWVDWPRVEEGREASLPEGQVTQIHRFDISGPGRATYRASGEVPGWLLNQFAMDEHDGYLRVASTDSPPFLEGGRSQSMVTVLADRGGRLAEVGRVTGLGKGERIFAVRFLGDLGYVVTFRQVDPLYVVDLSDPTRPQVAGELKVQGYSAYLHPLGDGLLLGVGQDATRGGRVTGTQLSIFDVSDPSLPRRLDRVQVSDGQSEVEWDHHAFLYWEPEGLVVVPLTVYRWDEASGTEDLFVGALAARVRDGRIQMAGRLTQRGGSGKDWGMLQVRRSLVVGDLLLTVSEAGVEAADLHTLKDVAWVPFR